MEGRAGALGSWVRIFAGANKDPEDGTETSALTEDGCAPGGDDDEGERPAFRGFLRVTDSGKWLPRDAYAASLLELSLRKRGPIAVEGRHVLSRRHAYRISCSSLGRWSGVGESAAWYPMDVARRRDACGAAPSSIADPFAQPEGFKGALCLEQALCVAWMLDVECGRLPPLRLDYMTSVELRRDWLLESSDASLEHDAELQPYEVLAEDGFVLGHRRSDMMSLLTEVAYQPQGGVVDVRMGGGKTAIVLALLLRARDAAAKEERPAKKRRAEPGPEAPKGAEAGSSSSGQRQSPGRSSEALPPAPEHAATPEGQKKAVKASDLLLLPPKPLRRLKSEEACVESRATLVLVTANLVGQWLSEVAKWIGPEITVIRLSTAAAMKSKCVAALQDADVVLVTYQFFLSDGYKQCCRGFDAEGAEASSSAWLPLHKYRWARIVLDEVQELVQPGAVALLEKVGALQASRATWALSGTPPREVATTVERLAALLGVHLAAWGHVADAGSDAQVQERLRRFQGRCFWTSFAESYGAAAQRLRGDAPALRDALRTTARRVDHLVAVTHTAAEKALYLSAERSGYGAEGLLKLCSHYRPSGETSSAKEECGRLLREKSALVEERKAALRAAMLGLRGGLLARHDDDGLRTQCYVAWASGSVQWHPDARSFAAEIWDERRADPSAPGPWAVGEAELLARAARCCALGAQLSTHLKERAFLEATTREILQEGAAWTCSICLQESRCSQELPTRAITPCAHVFCEDCLRRAVARSDACPTCRATVSDRSLRTLRPPCATVYDECGSKLRAVATTLLTIRAEEPGAKVILFVQYNDLARRVASAMQLFELPCVQLQGNPATRDAIIRDWQSGLKDSACLLVLSLDKSPSGIDLTAANHVMLLHPMHADSTEEAAACDAQAVCRILRPGQRKSEVHVWRFVTEDTIEEKMARAQCGELFEGRPGQRPEAAM